MEASLARCCISEFAQPLAMPHRLQIFLVLLTNALGNEAGEYGDDYWFGGHLALPCQFI